MGTNMGAIELLDARQVAEKLSVGIRSVWRWSDAGTMPRPVRLGRLQRWRALELDAWVDAGCPAVKPANATPKAVRPASRGVRPMPVKATRPASGKGGKRRG